MCLTCMCGINPDKGCSIYLIKNMWLISNSTNHATSIYDISIDIRTFKHKRVLKVNKESDLILLYCTCTWILLNTQNKLYNIQEESVHYWVLIISINSIYCVSVYHYEQRHWKDCVNVLAHEYYYSWGVWLT